MHIALDMVGYFLLIAATANIGMIQYYLDPTDASSYGGLRLLDFMLPLCIAVGIWCLRFLELALFSTSEPSRR